MASESTTTGLNANASDNNGLAAVQGQATIMSTQLENALLKEELKKLQVTNDSNAVEGRNSNRKKDEKSRQASVERDIALQGRKYSLMISPWLEQTHLSNIKGRPNVNTKSETCFSNPKSMKDDVVAELYDFLPLHLHKALENNPEFLSVFRHHLQNTRSNAILAVRQKSGLIFDTKQEYFETSYDRTKVDEFQKLLKVPGKDEYAFLAPVLFAGGKYDPQKKTFLKNVILPRIVKTILCGRSGANVSKPQTLAELWNVTEVTPGVIAFSAILARYLLSPEEELRKVGKVTGINWQEDFIKYKRLLLTDSKKVREIFKFFNKNVFSRAKPERALVVAPEKDYEDFEDLMRVIKDEDDDDDDDDSVSVELDTLNISDDGMSTRPETPPNISATVSLGDLPSPAAVTHPTPQRPSEKPVEDATSGGEGQSAIDAAGKKNKKGKKTASKEPIQKEPKEVIEAGPPRTRRKAKAAEKTASEPAGSEADK